MTGATDRRLALVALADDHRLALAAYLQRAGFDVHEYPELAVATSFAAIVWLAGDSAADDLVARVRRWLRSAKLQRVVVVTARPVALRELAAAHPDRLTVLPAPAFGWDLIDALRATPAPRPRGA